MIDAPSLSMLTEHYDGFSDEWSLEAISYVFDRYVTKAIELCKENRMSSPPDLPMKTEEHPGVIAKWMPEEIQQVFAVETTLPQQTSEERSAVLALIDGEQLAGETLIGQKIYLGHYIIHPIELEDKETGEMVPAARTLLVQPDGPPVAFVSTGVLQSIARIAWARRQNPPFLPPILVRLVQRGTKGGRRTYKLMQVKE